MTVCTAHPWERQGHGGCNQPGQSVERALEQLRTLVRAAAYMAPSQDGWREMLQSEQFSGVDWSVLTLDGWTLDGGQF